jgi:hypothetical protein
VADWLRLFSLLRLEAGAATGGCMAAAPALLAQQRDSQDFSERTPA